jgi:hypothetical protein
MFWSERRLRSQPNTNLHPLFLNLFFFGHGLTPSPFSVARLELDDKHRLRMILELPSVGVTAFVLKAHETLGELLKEIRAEDEKLDSLVMYYEDGRRVAHTTTIEDLVKSGVLRIGVNGVMQEMRIHSDILEAAEKKELEGGGSSAAGGVLSVDDVSMLVKRGYFYKIRQRCESDPRKTITVDEFYRWANEYGVDNSDAKILLKALHTSAVVQHFESNAELSKFIFLKPDELLFNVANSLGLRLLSKGDGTNLAALARVEREIAVLDQEKQKFDSIARKHANKLMFGLFVALLAQFGILADMVWIDFNWDIMEPITYFVTLTTVIGGFSFFIKSKRDYTYPALAERFANSKLRKLYIANRFNYKTWSALDQERSSLVSKIGSGPYSSSNISHPQL